ncbi:MAG: ADOP family duplicated permease [Longimicrobiales bacterium]
MTWLWRNLFRQEQADDELNEELQYYVRMLAEERMKTGMSPEAAHRAAMLDVGSIEALKQDVRAVRTGAWLDGLLQDIRYALRALTRVPTFAATAIIALALGIGASTAIFSVVNGVLLRPLPYHEPERLVTILHSGANPVAGANFVDWRAQTASFSDMGAADFWTPNFSSERGDAERLLALKLTPSVLPMLGIRPEIGRVFGPETAETGRDHEVVLGYGIWQRRFAGDSSVLGRSVLIDGNSYIVIGVMPKSFGFAPFWARGAQLWLPLALGERATNRGQNSLRVFARLKAGVSIQQARADIAGVTDRLEAQFPGTNGGVEVTPLLQMVSGSMEKPLTVLLIAVGFLLVAACANVAHMLLARSAARQREMAVRIAMGATRAKLTRQLLCESLMLSIAGGVIGLAIAIGGTRGLIALGGGAIPRADEVTFDARVLVVTMLISVITGALFGLAPALNAAGTDLVSSLKNGGRAQTSGTRSSRVRQVLVASQFAVALTLLIGAGLMMRTLSAMNAIDPGFDSRGVVSAVVSVGGTSAEPPGARNVFYENLLARTASMPGVRSTTAINHLPIAGDIWGVPVWFEGQPIPRPGEGHGAIYRIVFPNYLATMGIPLERGRDVTAQDRMGAELVAVVNHRFAEHFWPGEDAIRKRFTIDDPRQAAPQWIRVVGIAKNSLRSSWIERPDDEMYLPFLQNRQYMESNGSNVAYMTVIARVDGDPNAFVGAFRRIVGELNRDAPVSQVQTMDQVVSAATAGSRFFFVLFVAFAGGALTLAAVGIYGVMSHAVSKRTHEIGLRVALGARPADVRQLIVNGGMSVVVIGAVAGVGAALGLSRLMGTVVYGVQPTDPITFSGVTVFLLAVALVACLVPARRATKIDPLAALRSD